MFLIDDILLFPVRGVASLARRLHGAARQELANEAEATRARLTELYMMLETGEITEDEFDEREKALLDQLDEIDSRSTQAGADSRGN